MEQGNCLDSTPVSARQEAHGANDEPALDAAVTALLTRLEDSTHAPQVDVADLASACLDQVKRLDDWDANPGSLTEEEGGAEMDRWRALFERAIDTPSANLRDLAGKAHLMLDDLNRFHPLEENNTDDCRLMRVILAEAMAFGDLAEVRSVGAVRPRDRAEAAPILAMTMEGRRLMGISGAPQGESPDLGKPVDAATPAPDAARALAARVIAYFGDKPIPEFLNADIEVRDMARALLDGVPDAGAEVRADPIFAVINSTYDLTWARNRALNMELPPETEDPTPEQNAATDAFFEYVNDVLLKTVPTTAAGCTALERYAVEFRADYGFNIDEDASNEQHVRILDLIGRSPLLDGLPPARPAVPDFSGMSANDLMRTYNAFKMANDIFGLTGWTTSKCGNGDDLLNAEADRLSFFQGYLADELKRRELLAWPDTTYRFETIIDRAITCGDFDEAARFAAEAAAKGL
jgi:hypothetical protein